MKDLSADDRSDKYISHALQVRAAAQLGNYCAFFRLYSDAPGHSGYVMDTFIGRERFAALRRICRAYQPSVPLAAVSDALAFDDAAECGQFVLNSLQLVALLLDGVGEFFLLQLYARQPRDDLIIGELGCLLSTLIQITLSAFLKQFAK